MSAPTTSEFLAFIHGALNGHAAALAGMTTGDMIALLNDVEAELNIPPAEVGEHPCFVAIRDTLAWRSRMERSQ